MLDPVPGNDGVTNRRHTKARERRDRAASIATARNPQLTRNNGEINAFEKKPTNFHKGVPHDRFGMPDPEAFRDFVTGLNRELVPEGAHAPFDVAIGPEGTPGSNPGNRTPGFAVTQYHTQLESGEPIETRNWESPLGGHAFDLEGPDAGDVAMAPAPTVCSGELTAEIAEVYALALLRDTDFESLQDESATINADGVNGTVGDILSDLRNLDWFDQSASPRPSYGHALTQLEHNRRRARLIKGETNISARAAFRGSVPGAKEGHYLSQFLLIGNGREAEAAGRSAPAPTSYNEAKDTRQHAPASAPYGGDAGARSRSSTGGAPGPQDGYIVYGAQRIDQRVNVHYPGVDYLTDWTLWLDTQNGADVRGADSYYPDGRPRFMRTPRDLATFVHFDQLYQAYLNACLLLFTYNVPFDYGMPTGPGHKTRGSFATFGGPHLLSLMTEVASRGLKAVRRQKFQHHLRGRPEQLAAMITLAASGDADQLGDAKEQVQKLYRELSEKTPNLLHMINARNEAQNLAREHAMGDDPNRYPRHADGNCGFAPDPGCNYLLPMAFPEGSPMHAAYGAGHATVAGACTTILKAFFEMSASDVPEPKTAQPLTVAEMKKQDWWDLATFKGRLGLNNVYCAPEHGADQTLEAEPKYDTAKLTIEGELNKLAANIAIGRDMAGVHFYTDYYDSLRMGERIAVGILEEQMSTYVEPVAMRLHSFDNDAMIISGDGNGGALVEVRDGHGHWVNAKDEWWDRHVHEFFPQGMV